MKKTEIILTLCLVWLLLLSIYLIFNPTRSLKIGAMDNLKVFNDFDFKKQQDSILYIIEDSLSQELNNKIEVLNQLRREIKNSPNDVGLLDEYNYQKEALNEAKNSIEQVLKKESSRLTNEVYKKLNEYIEEFGNKERLTSIIGANGKGSLMFYSKSIDVTDDLIAYINEKVKR